MTNPRARLRVGDQHSHIRPILVRFVHYHSAFWGPRAISTINETRGSFMCPSSTLRVLANSDGFRGLLLTDLGSRSDSHSCRTPRCAYVSVINTHSFGQFWPVSWTITLFLGLGVISMFDEHRGAFMCRSSNTRSFGRFWPVSWTIAYFFGAPE